MRKIILQEFITLDGLAAGPNNSVDFVPSATKGDQSFGREQMKLMEGIDTILLGSATYQLFIGYWPKVTEGEEKEFADKLNATPKIVFSKKLKRAPWGKWDEAKVVKNAADEITRLKQQAGKNMVIWGSISVAQSLMTAKLIDEYRLVICPVVLGNGRALFENNLDKSEMRLVEAKTFDRGAVLLHYTMAKGQSGDKEISEASGEKRQVA
jgi:dihydrofolate reductase